jgi:predicted nuclease with TOPRIM domain
MSLADLFRGSKQNKELRQEIDQLKRRIDALDEEWSDYYDRFRRMLAKMAKRAERESASEVREDAPTEGVSDTSTNALTPSQQQIQARILARRNRLTAVGGG